jgi:hypothetical protein
VVPFTGASAALRPRLQNGTFFSAGALVALFNMNEFGGEESHYFDFQKQKQKKAEIKKNNNKKKKDMLYLKLQ